MDMPFAEPFQITTFYYTKQITKRKKAREKKGPAM